jgi:predicted RNase H-like nuclease (RuvC/YqgF family)
VTQQRLPPSSWVAQLSKRPKHPTANCVTPTEISKFEILNLKFEISDLKFEISNLKFEISNLKFEITNLKSEISNLKFEISIPKPGQSAQNPWNADETWRDWT